jgi:hypothetical protein
MVKQNNLKLLEVRYKTYHCYTFRVQPFQCLEAPLDFASQPESVTRKITVDG